MNIIEGNTMYNDMEIFTSKIELVETSDSSLKKPERAIIKIPIINMGSNKKHLLWTEETMRKVASKFRGVPFRYDLSGTNEGSHTREHISSPFYDVGWTYNSEKGAYYDPVRKCVMVQGEVTHPDVIAKLMRKTSEGKREINYASMGAIMTPDQTKCSICGKSPFGSCNHVRGKSYNTKNGSEFAAMVPLDISKALHVALTNDPADKVAEIEQAIFQDMTFCNGKECELADAGARSDVATPVLNIPRGQEIDDIVGMVISKLKESNLILEDSNMKKKTKKGSKESKDKKVDEIIDDKDVQTMDAEEAVATEDKEEAKEVDGKKKKKSKKDKELPDMKEMADNSEFKISGVVNEKPVIETQDSAITIGKVEKTEIVETADNVYEEKYRSMLIKELADTYVNLGKAANSSKAVEDLSSKSTSELEIFQDAFDGLMITKSETKQSKSIVPKYKDVVKESDNNTSDIVPQYGGTAGGQTYAFQDLSPGDRSKKYGEYGSFDLCFHPQNAQKYLNKRK